MSTTIRYIFITAVRDWLFIGLFFSILAAVGISLFLGGTALVEQEVMTIVYAAGASRVILLVGLIVFVCFHVRRAFDNREVEVMLTKPISRTSFVFSYWAGFAVVSALFVLPVSVMMWLLMDVDLVGLLFWSVSLALEALLVVAFALACSLILTSAVTSVLVSFGFYLISRMMGFFTFIIERSVMKFDLSWGWLTENLLAVTSIILPRLDLFGNSKWLVYGIRVDQQVWLLEMIPVFLPQTLIYVPLLLFMAMFDFKRRQF